MPFWIYPLEHGAAVERHVLALPLSRELDRLDSLLNALAVYRLAFVQARQEDVIDHLLRRLGPTEPGRSLPNCESTCDPRCRSQLHDIVARAGGVICPDQAVIPARLPT